MSLISRTARVTEIKHRPTVSSLPPPLARAGTQVGGQALDRHTQREMSARFGHDFSSVRIHTDVRAEESASALGANAFAHGSDIVFGEGKYQPGSRETERLLAHELTHIVQQARNGSGDWGRASQREDASEREADALASQVMTGRSVEVQAAPDAAIARDEADLTCSTDDPGPDLSAQVCAPGLPDPMPVPSAVVPPTPSRVYGPQLKPPDPEDVSSPLDPSSRTCVPDPDPADVSCGMDPDDFSCPMDIEPDPQPDGGDARSGGGASNAPSDLLSIGLNSCGLLPGWIGKACSLGSLGQSAAQGPETDSPDYGIEKTEQIAGGGLSALSLLGVEFAGPLGLVLAAGMAGGHAAEWLGDKMIEGGIENNPGQFGPDPFDVFNEGQQGYGP